MIPIIDHINRYVSNIDIFITFYENALGYELIGKGIKSNGKRFAVLRGCGHELFISEKDDFAADDTTNFRHMGYSVTNIQDLLEQLKADKFVTNTTEIITKRFSNQFYIKDPDGFEIDLIEWTDKKDFYESFMQK